MNLYIIVGIAAAVLVLIILVAYLVTRSVKKKRLPSKIEAQWLEIQRLCASKETWSKAVIDADLLLSKVLKKLRFKGKSTGEKLVSAQRKISDNDAVWYAHKIAKKLEAQERPALRESEAKKALIGIRQALRDLGAMREK